MAAAQPDDTERLFDPMTQPDDTFGDEALAAEYVLHLLDAEDRRAFETRLREDQVLRMLVTEWEIKLAGMAEVIEPVEPPNDLKSSVMRAIEGPAKRSPIFGWKPWARIISTLVVTGFVGFLLLTNVFEPKPDMTPAFRAELSSTDNSVVLVASVIPATHEIVVEPVLGTPPQGRIFELWLIAESAQAPISLGVLATNETTRIRVPDDIAPSVRTGTIAISDEPPGGSPSGQPTGSVLATATFEDI